MPAPKGNKNGKATQFKKGETGNPNGRPKGKTLTERVRDILETNPDKAQAIVDAGVAAAIEGDFQFWKYLFDRLEGTPAQQVQVKADITHHVKVYEDGEANSK
jgi:hypothetical protein